MDMPSFPVKEKFFIKGKEDVSIWEQFINAADLQKHWADNQVSVTVTFKQEEAKDIRSCLEAFETKLKSVSMLPLKGHGYEQAPYVSIDEKEYNRLTSNITPIRLDNAVHEVTEKFCDGDKCVLPT